MIKSITKIGNSQGLILDAAIMDLARLKIGDEVNVTVHEGGALTVVPMRPRVTPGEFSATLDGVVRDYGRTLKKLA